jgi:hypothetical protein
VTIPKTLLSVDDASGNWTVKIDDKLLTTEEIIITENDTYTSIYFTYSAGFHYVQITTRPLINSIISITLSSTNVNLASDVTISGNITANDPTDPGRPGMTVTILYRWEISVSGKVLFQDWNTFATFAMITTDSNSHYSYTRTLEKAGTYEFMAMWEGDNNTFGDVSDAQTLTVLPIYVFEVEDTQVIIQTNSTISAFNFSQPLKQINFNVTGPPGTIGFCNISIPDNLLSGEFSVYMDGSLLVKDKDYIQTYNGTHYIFCITYTHSTHVIEIRSTEVIPEIPTWTSVLLILILLTVAIATYKRRLLKASFR